MSLGAKFHLKKQFWNFGPNLPEKDTSCVEKLRWT